MHTLALRRCAPVATGQALPQQRLALADLDRPVPHGRPGPWRGATPPVEGLVREPNEAGKPGWYDGAGPCAFSHAWPRALGVAPLQLSLQEGSSSGYPSVGSGAQPSNGCLSAEGDKYRPPDNSEYSCRRFARAPSRAHPPGETEDTTKDGRGHATLAASVYPAASLVTSFLLRVVEKDNQNRRDSGYRQ